MSNSSTPGPQSSSRGSTPVVYPTASDSSVPSSKASSSKPKPVNVFSNDGSFLERLQRSKKVQDDEERQRKDLMMKRNFDDRFKRRGKRPPPEEESSLNPPEDQPMKKVKSEPDKPLTAYEKEVKSYSGSLKDDGIGIRPLVK